MPVREILGLRASGLSATVMARTQPVSKTSAAICVIANLSFTV